jgi:hypothetical protein
MTSSCNPRGSDLGQFLGTWIARVDPDRGVRLAQVFLEVAHERVDGHHAMPAWMPPG